MKTLKLAEEAPYRLSRFCHIIPINEVVVLYHSFLLKTLLVDPQIAELLKAFKKGITTKVFLERMIDEPHRNDVRKLLGRMLNLKMILPVCEKEEDEIVLLNQSGIFQPDITGMYLMLTDSCNFACRYCFVEQPLSVEHCFSAMSKQNAVNAIDKFAEWSNPEFVRTIIFCGGEPLLNKNALLAALDRVDYHISQGTLSNDLKLQLITNGSLVNKGIALLAKKHNLKVSVSIDGMPEYHNASRVTNGGKDTYDLAVRGYKMLKDEDVTVGISFTISKKHVGHLLENVLWLIDQLGIKSIGFNTLMDIDRSVIVPTSYAEQVNKEMIECFKVLRKMGIYEDRMMRKVESFIDKTLYIHDCAGCGHQVVVSPNGKVGVCHGYAGWKKYFVNPDDGFIPVQHEYWREWAMRSPINMPQCYDCEALGICGGGCPCSADIRSGSIWTVNETFCLHAKTMLRWMLEEVCA